MPYLPLYLLGMLIFSFLYGKHVGRLPKKPPGYMHPDWKGYEWVPVVTAVLLWPMELVIAPFVWSYRFGTRFHKPKDPHPLRGEALTVPFSYQLCKSEPPALDYIVLPVDSPIGGEIDAGDMVQLAGVTYELVEPKTAFGTEWWIRPVTINPEEGD